MALNTSLSVAPKLSLDKALSFVLVSSRYSQPSTPRVEPLCLHKTAPPFPGNWENISIHPVAEVRNLGALTMLVLFQSPATNVSPHLTDSLSGTRPKSVHLPPSAAPTSPSRTAHPGLAPRWPPASCSLGVSRKHGLPIRSVRSCETKIGSSLSAAGLSLPPHHLSQTRPIPARPGRPVGLRATRSLQHIPRGPV